MLQLLTYYTLSNTAVLENEFLFQQIYSDVSLNISASAYDTIDSGSTDFGVTVGEVRIDLISGSTLIASFPYDQTNLIINSSSLFYTTSSDNIGIQYITQISGSDPDFSYYFKIINSSSLETKTDTGIFPFQNINFISLNSSSLYNIQLYSGNNKQNNVYVYNSASVLLLSSSWIGTSSYGITLNPTASNFYFISASVNTVCCSPFLSSITDDGSSLFFSYITGSCGIYSGSIDIQSSTDQFTWTSIGTGSFVSPFTASIPIPGALLFYRLIAQCSGSIFSDPSNTLYYEAPYSP